jgi:hypothetical protein
LRIAECGLGIEFEEGIFGGELSTNPQFEIRNPQFSRADWGLNLKKGFLAGN